MPTINDVARRAGVSPVTVSRVINNVSNVNPATRVKVERAIQDLGYVPSVAARSLRSKRTSTLALVLPDITNAFWTTVARGVEDAAQSCGYSVFLYNSDETPSKQLRYLDVIASQRVDGVIIAPYDSDARNLAGLRARNIPTVVIDRRIKGWDVDTVYGDSVSGAYALIQHLIGLGHQRIAMVSGPPNTSTAEDRVTGYYLALIEAGIPVSPSLVKHGEFQAVSGERLTYQLLDEGLNPTAIFAANNAIAIGVIDALEKRGLHIPQDIAVVCFDDLPNASRFFPFLTVAVQPAYDMGVNAAQLLLSRLEAEGGLQPRQVVLPARLLIRYSCGSKPQHNGDYMPRLPSLKQIQTHSILVKPIGQEALRQFASGSPVVAVPSARKPAGTAGYDKSDVNRLLKALRHQEADRVPYLEFWVSGKSIYEYILGRRLDVQAAGTLVSSHSFAPEDQVEFALRLGMDAVTCNFCWQPNNRFEKANDGSSQYRDGTLKTWADLDDLEPPPPLAAQLSLMERYLRAAQGTGVGVVANFSSFFSPAMRAVGGRNALGQFQDNKLFLENLMDILLVHQEKVLRAICDRFAADLAFVLISDEVAGPAIPSDLFMEIFSPRMQRLILPAQEHGKLLVMHTKGKLDQVLPIVHEIGFAAVHPIQTDLNDIFQLKKSWGDTLAFIGGIPIPLLVYGREEEIEAQVRECCAKLGPGGGYVLGSSNGIEEDVPPKNLVAMIQAVQKYGRYGYLGREA